MQQEIAVNINTLSSDVETLQNQLNTIKRDMDKMYEAVQKLDAMWDGPANDAFRLQFNKDHTDMQQLCENVQKVIECMTYAKNEYNTCENEVSGIIAAIRV